jgi:hypothetical protein
MNALYSKGLTACLLVALPLLMQTSIVSAEPMVSKPKIVAKQLQQSTNRRKDFTKVRSSNSDPSRDSIFQFSASGNKYKIKANGLGVKESGNLKPTKFNLKIANGDFIESLSFLDFENNILILASITDNEGSGGSVYSLSKTNSQVKWVANIPGFNIGDVTIEDNYAYITAIGVVSKLDLRSGKYMWKHTNLYQKNKAFGYFDRPEIQGKTVIFRGSSTDGDAPKNIVVDKISGKIIAI